jgi:hypothetical protein
VGRALGTQCRQSDKGEVSLFSPHFLSPTLTHSEGWIDMFGQCRRILLVNEVVVARDRLCSIEQGFTDHRFGLKLSHNYKGPLSQ